MEGTLHVLCSKITCSSSKRKGMITKRGFSFKQFFKTCLRQNTTEGHKKI
jgi:hypothetical protein